MNALDRLTARTLQAFVPPKRLPPSGWLDEHREIGRGYPSPFPGPWRTDRTPYLREPIDAFVDPDVETIVLLFSSQIGKTEALMGSILYAFGTDPAPGMFAMPTLELAQSVSTDRISSALKTCEVLNVGTSKSRSTDNAVLHKRINGAPLVMAGANSPAGLSSRPVRYLWCDEIDRWPATTAEGDPLALVIQRARAFRRRKIVLTSTPTIKGASRIEDWYERSDQRILMAPCPRCSVAFEVQWSNVRWNSGDPSSAFVECPKCRGRIEDHERAAMFAAAKWVATAPFNGIAGFKTWAIVSPWVRLSEMVSGFLTAKAKPETLQAWVNLTRGESWEVPSEKVESASLMIRREKYATDVPAGAMILTAGIDTQDDRLEALVVGWGVGEESWIVARESIFGDPQSPETWSQLDEEILLHPWAREAGGLARVQCALVDALGHKTSAVYAAVIARQSRRVFASIGRDGGDAAGSLVSTPKAMKTQQGLVNRYVVDASQAKAMIYSRLRLEDREGAGVVHFPMSVGDAFFSELTAEHLLTQRNRYGVPSKKWALRPGRSRNEALDCFGMALAAIRAICPTPARFEELARRLDVAAGSAAKDAERKTKKARRPRTESWNGTL